MYFNSPGGYAYDGFQISNRIQQLREEGRVGRIEAHAEGLVGSAATLPFLAGDVRSMRNGSRFMVHEPWAGVQGNPSALRAAAAKLDQTKEEMLDLYEARSHMSREDITTAVEAETYYTPKEAMEAGFATEVVPVMAIAACMSESLLSRFEHFPTDVLVEDPGKRRADLEARIIPVSEW